jgi:hypothetical protein
MYKNSFVFALQNAKKVLSENNSQIKLPHEKVPNIPFFWRHFVIRVNSAENLKKICTSKNPFCKKNRENFLFWASKTHFRIGRCEKKIFCLDLGFLLPSQFHLLEIKKN